MKKKRITDRPMVVPADGRPEEVKVDIEQLRSNMSDLIYHGRYDGKLWRV